MKMSVLLGVAQMTVGVLLRFSNAIYLRSAVVFFCECCPMLVFMVCFFGYMDFMILYKWVNPEFPNGPPSLINSLISMGMGQPDEQPLFEGSIALEQNLMIACLISVPWLLIPKPVCLVIMNKMKSKPAEGEGGALPHGGEGGHAEGGNSHEEEFKLDEIIIHQIIETIEYVLGTVSHTASYLRQWALSLAHQQLSIVFMQKTLTNAWEMSYPFNAIGIFLAFAAWFGITLGVLLGMDVLECFLHTLRLHWVEFQSKFFHADGYLFAPYGHKKMLEEASA
jgi:V-type H+-transporting ATPase subunit a